MNVFVDTSVWSLAFRRDKNPAQPEVDLVSQLIRDGENIFTTGLVIQELLQGFRGPKQSKLIQGKLAMLPLIVPTWADHVEAAALRNECRSKGFQIETIDALLAQLCIRRQLLMLTTDQDFTRIADHSHLRLLKGPAAQR